MENQIRIIGVSSSELSSKQRKILTECSIIVGGKRLLSLCNDIPVKTISITPLNAALSIIREYLEKGDVAVLASGDPLFFGIGKRLIVEFGSEVIQIYPALSSLQEAFARFKLPWDDAKIISLHGRNHIHTPGLLLENAKTVVFTDNENSPDKLAVKIIDYLELIGEHSLLADCKILVAEDLGDDTEKLFSGSLQETAASSFSSLNVMCLLTPKIESESSFGLHEQEIQHSRGLITKAEIRAITLHRLHLPNEGIFWDVGAGSGSISIEAARMNPGLTVYAIERKQEELENIKSNIRKYGCYNIIPVAGNALDVLGDLPDPHRVFIGGNGGQLEGIVKEAASRMEDGGCVVANGVIEKTITQAPKIMKDQGLTVTQSRINFSRTDTDGQEVSFNPITIITGDKFV
ncbi:MAG: precorrin-6y C5,15-methyltransferase (decarboxylating) subunit CbiE [Desulfocapsa sp.]|nr:precorrin-6y C5,15-methyltransferase (decarboxylating) subunit CbiE [Desulfocapsa sp.]